MANRHGDSGRLYGWKEIAAHLGMSVRTAQRWEKGLRLPVRRIQGGRSASVFAFSCDLDDWLQHCAQARLESAEGAKGRDGVSALWGRRLSGAWRRAPRLPLLLGIVAFGAVALAWLASEMGPWPASSGPGPGAFRSPVSWEIRSDRLIVYERSDRPLWEHRFGFALDPDAYTSVGEFQAPLVVFDDLDGDGTTETLFLAVANTARNRVLYSFGQDGRLRFSYQPKGPVSFGSDVYEPPFSISGFLVTRRTGGGKNIWVVARHLQSFPSVVQKLSPDGRLVSAYWSDGHVSAIAAAELRGLQVLLVGGTCNESGRASLTVLDQDNASGSAPAHAGDYRCTNCAPGAPLKRFLFPGLELWRVMEVAPYVREIEVDREGQHFTVQVAGRLGSVDWGAHYVFDDGLRLTRAAFDKSYARAHLTLELLGRLKHRFGDTDTEQLLPIAAWDGGSEALLEIEG